MSFTLKSMIAAGLVFWTAFPSGAVSLVEPALHLKQSRGAPRVALTLDACGGGTDERILSALVENRIPATIFVTAKWLKHNSGALAIMRAHPALFELENHGGRHVPAIDARQTVYGLRSAGSAQAVAAEVESERTVFAAAGGPSQSWFRGATAKYSPSAIRLIRQLGFKVAGYSLNGDGGSLLSAAETARRVSSARDGDVIIAHINQPSHAAGEGLVKGMLALKGKGFSFVRLEDADSDGTDGTTD